jgi:hypothetical protein
MSPYAAIFLVFCLLVQNSSCSTTSSRLKRTYPSNLYQDLEETSRFREEPAPVLPETGLETPAILSSPEVAAPPIQEVVAPPTQEVQLSHPQPVRIPTKDEQDATLAAQAEENDPEMVKLESAYEAVKEDILTNNKKIVDEKKWVEAVTKITASYEEKVKRVEEHIIVLRKAQKALFKKKKQLENLKLQRRLEAKLLAATQELTALQESLKHVQIKNEELNKSHMDLRATIISIENQLAKLKGEDAKMKEGEGEDAAAEASGEAAAADNAEGSEAAAAEDVDTGAGAEDNSP